MDEPRRRDLLGTIAGLGGVVGTAGCLGVLNGDGGSRATTTDGSPTGTTTAGSADGEPGTTAGSTTVATAGPTDTGSGTTATETTTGTTTGTGGEFGGFAAWTPPRSAFETDRLSVGYAGMASVRDHTDELPRRTAAILLQFVSGHASNLGLAAESVDHDLLIAPSYEGDDVVRSVPIHVLSGEFAASTVLESDAVSGFEAAGSHRRYDLYTDQKSAVAVRDGMALRAPGLRLSGKEYLRAVLDARTGDGERFVDANADADLAMGGMSSVDFLQARSDPWAESTPPSHFEGNVAFARGFTFEGATTRLEWRFVFERAGQVDLPAIRSSVAENRKGLSTYDYTVEADGRVAVISGTTPTSEFDILAEGTP